MDWLCVPKGGASVVSLCVGCFRAPGIQEAVLNCTACIQLVPLSGPGRLLPHVRQAVLSPIVSMQALQCPSQEQQDALVVLYRTGELAVLVYAPEYNRFITIQHIMLAPGAAAQHCGRLLLAAPGGHALAVAAWQDRLQLLPVSWQPEERQDAAAQQLHSTRGTAAGPVPPCNGISKPGGLLLPVVGSGMAVQLSEADVAGAKATYATCPEVGAPLTGPHATVWHAAFLGTPADAQEQLLAVLIHRPQEHASEVQVWGWQAQAGTPPRLLASLPRLHSPPKGSGLPLGLPLGLLPLPGDAPGVVLYGTCGLQHLLLRLPSDSAWGACDIADMDQDGPLPPHATSQTGAPGLAEARSSCSPVSQPCLVEGHVLDLAAVLQATRPSIKQQQQQQQQLEPLVSAAVWSTVLASASSAAPIQQQQQQPVLLVSSSTGGVVCIRPPSSPAARLQARLCSMQAPIRPAQAVAALASGQLLWLEGDGDLLLLEVQAGSSALPRPLMLRSAGIPMAPVDTPPGMQQQVGTAPADTMMAAAASPVVGGRKGSSPHPPPSAAGQAEGGSWGPVAHPIMQLTDSDSISPSTTLSPEEVTAAAAATATAAAAAAAGEAGDPGHRGLPCAPLAHLPLPIAPPGLHLVVAARLPQLGPVLSAVVVPGSSSGGPGSRGEGGSQREQSVLIAAGPHGLQRWSPGAATAVVGASPPGLLPALTGLWALPWAPEGPAHHLLLLSCATGTRALAAGPSSSSWQDVSEEVVPHLVGQQLVAAGCIAAGLLVLATSEALMLCPWELPGAAPTSSSPPEAPAAQCVLAGAAGGTQGGPTLPADLSQLPPPVAAVPATARPRGPLENAFWSAWSRAWHGTNTGAPGGSNNSSSSSGRVHTQAPVGDQHAPCTGAAAAAGSDMGAVGQPAAAAAVTKSASPPLWQWHWAPEHGLEFWSRHVPPPHQQPGPDAMEEDLPLAGAAQQQQQQQQQGGHATSLSCAAVCAGYVAVQLAPRPLLVLLRLVDGTSPSSSSRRSHGSSGTSSGSMGGGEVPVECQRSRKRSRLGQHLLEVAVGGLPVQVSCLALAAAPNSSMCGHPLVCAGTYDGSVAVFAACGGSAVLQQLVTVPLASPSGRQLPLPPPLPPTGPLLVPHSCCWLPVQPWQALAGPLLAVGTRGGTLALLSLPSSALQPPSSTSPSGGYEAPAGVADTTSMAAAAAAVAALGSGVNCRVLSQLDLGRAPLHVECLPPYRSQVGPSAEPLQLLVVGEGAWRVSVAPSCGRLSAQRLDVGSSTPWVVALRPPSSLLGCGPPPAPAVYPPDDASPAQLNSLMEQHTAAAAGRTPFPTPRSSSSGAAEACSNRLLLAMVPSDGSLQLVSVSSDSLGHSTLLLPGARVASLVHHSRSGLVAAAVVQPGSPGTPNRSPTAAAAARVGEAGHRGVGAAAGGGGKERQRVALVEPVHGGIACCWWAPAGEAIVTLATWEAAPGVYADQVSRAAGRRRSLLSSATPGGAGGSSSHMRRHSSGAMGQAAAAGGPSSSSMGGGGPASWHAPSAGLLSGEAGALQGLPQLLCRLQAASTSSPERMSGAGGSPAAGRAAPVAVHPLLLVGSNQVAGGGDGCASHLRVLQVLGHSEAHSPPFGRSNGSSMSQWHSSAPVPAGGSTSSSSSWGWSLQQVAWLRLPHVLHCVAALDEQHILVSTGHVLAAYKLQTDGKLACVAHVLPRAPVTSLSVSPEGLVLAGDLLAGVVGYRLTHIQQLEGPPQASLDAVWVQQEVAPVRQLLALPAAAGSSGPPVAFAADGSGRLLQLGAWEAPLVPLRSLFTTAALQLPGPLAAFMLVGRVPHAAAVLGGHLVLVQLAPDQAAWLQRVLGAVSAVDGSGHQQLRLGCMGRPAQQQHRRGAAAADEARQPKQQCLLDASAVTDFLGWPRGHQLRVAQQLLLSTGADAEGAAERGEEALVQLLAWLEALLGPA